MNNVFSVQELFAGKVLQIPDYQRGYSWELRQWDELLEDLEFLAPGKDHYTGSVVLHKQDEVVHDDGGLRHEVFHVVDGQQRLATLVILLDAIRSRLRELRPKLSRGICTSYLYFTDISGSRAFKLRLNSDCHDFFTHNVLGDKIGPQGPEIASHERLRAARRHVETYLDAKTKSLGKKFPDWLLDLHDKATQRLKLGQYLVTDSTEVGVIFEVMNNRGKPLSELEKVKNYLLYIASKLSVEEHTLDVQINAAWAEMFRRLMAAGLTDTDDENQMLRAHWLMAYDPDRRKWDGSKSIKDRFNLRTDHRAHKKLLADLTEYVQSLRDSVLVFCEVHAPGQTGAFSAYPEDRREDLRHWAKKLPRTRVVAQFLPLLVALRLRHPKDADAYLELLKLCELYAFRVYRWAGWRTTAGQTKLIRLGYDLYHKNTALPDISKIMRQMALSYSSDKNFQVYFEPSAEDEHNFYLWSGIRYFLYEYEEHLAKGRGIKMRWEDLERSDPQKTIEHVLPQKPKDKYWRDRFDRDARKIFTHSIGNLTLTFDNSVYQNKAYPDKRGDLKSEKPCFATSSLFTERKIAKDYEEWTQEAIRQRAKEIRNWALDRWHIVSADLPKEEIELISSDETEAEEE